MINPHSLSRFRHDLQLIPAHLQGRQVIIIQDPLGLVPEGIALTPQSVNLLALLEDAASLDDLQATIIHSQGGVPAPLIEIQRILNEFDRLFLLDSPRFQLSRRELVKAFSRQDSREPAMAGQAYPNEPEELSDLIRGILESTPAADTPVPAGHPVKAIITPHIDIGIGHRAYGRAYQAWPDRSPKRILLLGTGHSLGGSFFSVTRKHFLSPLGTLYTDREEVDKLLERIGTDGGLAPDDFAHRSEHSLEFQVLFIRTLTGDNAPRCIPILCGSFHSLLTAPEGPESHADISRSLSALSAVARAPDTLVIAAVDFSHIGPKFGHDCPAAELETAAREHDRRLLRALCAGDAGAIWAEAQRVGDGYNVCGLSTLMTLLHITGPLEGTVLDYEIWHENATDSAVSFAAAALWNRD